MKNELQRHKRSDKIKWAFTGIAFVLVFVFLIGVCIQAFAPDGKKVTDWFSKTCEHIDEDSDGICDNCGEEISDDAENADGNGGMFVSESSGNGMSLLSSVLPRSAYSENGVSEEADNVYILTATVKPDNTTENTGVDWTIKWQNAASSWAEGKTVTDYVTATPQGSGYAESKTVTLTNLQAFGEQIVVTAISRDNPEITASCTVDYAQSVEDFTLSFGTVNCNFGGMTDVTVELNADGTPAGGAANLEKSVSQVYTLSDTFDIDYYITPVETPFLYRDSAAMGSDLWLDFGYATEQYDRMDLETVNAKLDRSALTGYNVAQKGLYFGIQYFRDNMGLNGYYRYYRAGGVYQFPMSTEIFNTNFSVTNLINIYTGIQNGGTYHDDNNDIDYTVSGLDLFQLTVKITGTYSSVEKTTTFAMGGYSNTSSISAVELDQSSIVF